MTFISFLVANTFLEERWRQDEEKILENRIILNSILHPNDVKTIRQLAGRDVEIFAVLHKRLEDGTLTPKQYTDVCSACRWLGYIK